MHRLTRCPLHCTGVTSYAKCFVILFLPVLHEALSLNVLLDGPVGTWGSRKIPAVPTIPDRKYMRLN